MVNLGLFQHILYDPISPMIHSDPTLHTKTQGHWPFGSREEYFKGFTIYGHGGHFCQVTLSKCLIYVLSE